MTKISFKAIGIALIAAGLVVAGAAAPAQAATSGTISTNSFVAGSTITTTLTIEYADTSSTSSTYVNINTQSFVLPSTCSSSTPSTTLLDCGISALTINGAAPSVGTTVSKSNPVTLVVTPGSALSISSMSVSFAANQLSLYSNPTGTRYVIWQAVAGGSAVQQTPYTVTAPPVASLSPSSVTLSGTVGTPITPTTAFTPTNFVGAVTYSAQRRTFHKFFHWRS